MTHTDEADANDTWLGALRSDYQPTPSVARERIGARLAGAGLAAVAVGGAAAVVAAAPRGFWYSKLFVALATLPVGIMVGAAGHAWLAPAVVAPVAVRALPAAPASAPAAAAPLAVEPLPPVEPSKPPPTLLPVKARPPSSVAPSEIAEEMPGLEHELQLLERARTKLSESQPAAALAQLRQHRAQYPKSSLEQEREALYVRALLETGQRAEAKKRAAAFVQRYPSSVLRGSVERALGTIP